MSYSVIIPSKDASNLIPCVEAIRAAGETCRIIVVDDGLDLNRDLLFAVDKFIPGVKPFLFSRNINLGIRAAGTDDVILLNDDALLKTPNGFAKLAAFSEAHPEAGLVAPATNVTGQPLQWPKHRTPKGYRYVDTVPYVCVYIPRRTLDKVGLLDERYNQGYGCEDLDHTTAMRRAGLEIAVAYDVYVDHGSLHSSFRGQPHGAGDFSKNYAIYKQKWGRL